MSTIEQTKDEFLTACLADGTSREVCEQRWDAAHKTNPAVPATKPPVASTGAPALGDALREIEMLRARLKIRDDQLKQAITIANRANSETKARDNAQKQMLVSSIQMDSDFTQDELEKKHLNDLRTIRVTLDKSMAKTFASVAADMDAEKRKQVPFLTAGKWNGEKWVGGI